MRTALIGTVLCCALLGCEDATNVRAKDAPATAPAVTPVPVTIDGAQATPPAAGKFDSSKAWEHLRQMVAIGPRPAGSAALRQTRAYITRQLSAIGSPSRNSRSSDRRRLARRNGEPDRQAARASGRTASCSPATTTRSLSAIVRRRE